MIEFPEANALAMQLTEMLKGKKVEGIVAACSPHKYAWYHGDPADYSSKLIGKTFGDAVSWGGLVEVSVGDVKLLFGDGVALRFYSKDEKLPQKHQLLVEFEDETALAASVQMYGGLWCFAEGEFDSPYYAVAREKPSPLSDDFDENYFGELIDSPDIQKYNTKAFLATEQRIPGLGNGVLQDILYNAKIHPKQKISMLRDDEKTGIYSSVKSTLREMTELGGRDTEKNLLGETGGYLTKMSKNTVGQPCPVCGRTITKQAFMGGSIYFCPGCQKFP